MGYLAQEPSIFRKLSVEDNVMAILETDPTGPVPKTTCFIRLQAAGAPT